MINKYKAFDIQRETGIRSNVLMRCSIKEALFNEFFFFVLVFKFSVHVLTTFIYDIHYPSLNKLRKTSIKVMKTCRFPFIGINGCSKKPI